jgi:decaprenyl-phosphate phosphoribosyltransferase
VIFGLFRYWYVVESKEVGESPTDVVLTDGPLIACIIAWVGVCVVSLAP